MLATIILFISDLPMSKYNNIWNSDEIFAIELITGFVLSIIYYVGFIDLRTEKEQVYPYVMAGTYAAITIALPSFGSGNMIRLFAGLNDDAGFVLASIAGQLAGTLGGSMMYKYLFCDNKNIERKERAVNENDTKKMEF